MVGLRDLIVLVKSLTSNNVWVQLSYYVDDLSTPKRGFNRFKIWSDNHKWEMNDLPERSDQI